MAGANTVLLERLSRSGGLRRDAERGFVLQQRGAVSRALGPLGWPRRCRWRPGWPRLYPNLSYPASARPGPVSRGPRSGSCRARRACGCRRARWRRRFARPAARYSLARRLARTSGAAVTKIFTSARGQMTVPMSRPSSTAPGGAAAKSRWKAISAARTSGMAETTEAASPDRRKLQGSLVETRRIERLRRRDRRVDIVQAAAGIEQVLGHRAVDQAGVEMAQAVMGRQLLAERALARGGRPVDGDDHLTHPAAFLYPPLKGEGRRRENARRRGGVSFEDHPHPIALSLTRSAIDLPLQGEVKRVCGAAHAKSAPRVRISSTKPGKLVAMKAESSMRTGCSLARPSTSADMAMR